LDFYVELLDFQFGKSLEINETTVKKKVQVSPVHSITPAAAAFLDDCLGFFQTKRRRSVVCVRRLQAYYKQAFSVRYGIEFEAALQNDYGLPE
jgi:hypothetical protein